jgi:hypothetical protein
MARACSTHGEKGKLYGISVGNQKKKHINWMIILRCILEK